VDTLHGQAGSTGAVHIHGEPFKIRCDTSEPATRKSTRSRVSLVFYQLRKMRNGTANEVLPFQHEPGGNGDRVPGLPADPTDLNLAVAGEAVFEVILLRDWHTTLLGRTFYLSAR